MVITFNKRELLEFANWTIQQSKLPEKFCIEEGTFEENKEIVKLLKLLSPGCGLRADDPSDSNYRRFYLHVDLSKSVKDHLKRTKALSYKDNGFAEISLEILRTGMSFNDIKPLSMDDVDQWLKFQKGIMPSNTDRICGG